MSGALIVKPLATEWELVEPATELRPLSLAEIQHLMGFEPAGMFYGSPPCAHFAALDAPDTEVQP